MIWDQSFTGYNFGAAGGNGPKTISPIAVQSFQLLARRDLRSLAVCSYAHGRIADIRDRNEGGDAFKE